MSGHSKWHNIQQRKGAADKKKAAAFTRVARAILLAARTGGGSADTNFALRLAIEKAREVNMPKDNIDRAIKKGTGEDKEGAAFESVTYEGYGPARVGVIVEVVTNNKNRTASDIKNIFSKHGGAMGGPGSVTWQFEHCAVVHVKPEQVNKITDRDAFELALIDAGAQDITSTEDGGLTIYAPNEHLRTVSDAVHAAGVEPGDAGLQWRPKEFVDVSEAARESVESFFAALDEYDDVQEWYTNAR